MDKASREIVYKLYHADKRFNQVFLNAKKRGGEWFFYEVNGEACRLEVNKVSEILTEFEEVNGE